MSSKQIVTSFMTRYTLAHWANKKVINTFKILYIVTLSLLYNVFQLKP